MKWQRVIPFETSKSQQETWICIEEGNQKQFGVEVTQGKEIDILSLKVNMIGNFAEKVANTKSSRMATYQTKENLERVQNCPVCGNTSDKVKEVLNIYGASYGQCQECCHYFVLYRPTEEYLREFYKSNTEYQSTYADKRTLETRVEQVVTPKAKYVIQQYERIYGKSPVSILDVGAGSGHFVYACQQLGISCEGIEISDSGRAFCKENFGIDLIDLDFLKAAEHFNCDIVTFWGVIEHVPHPVEMLRAAHAALNDGGMIVADVPRWDCLSTAIHRALPTSVVRHLDPMDHIQCFSDSSLATAFTLSDYEIIAAWYFGMDAYELVTQISHVLNENRVIESMGKHISTLQERLDQAKLSDFMVFVGIPSK